MKLQGEMSMLCGRKTLKMKRMVGSDVESLRLKGRPKKSWMDGVKGA